MVRRAQAAMEFLVSYGWALLIILVTVGALAYFTGFYGKFVPPQCSVQPPWYCAEFKATNGTMILGLQPSGAMEDVSIIVFCNKNMVQNDTFSQALVADQQRLNGSLVYLSCPMSGSLFSANFIVTYKNSGETVSHDAGGSLRTQIE